jgi:hypothetical protein
MVAERGPGGRTRLRASQCRREAAVASSARFRRPSLVDLRQVARVIAGRRRGRPGMNSGHPHHGNTPRPAGTCLLLRTCASAARSTACWFLMPAALLDTQA